MFGGIFFVLLPILGCRLAVVCLSIECLVCKARYRLQPSIAHSAF